MALPAASSCVIVSQQSGTGASVGASVTGASVGGGVASFDQSGVFLQALYAMHFVKSFGAPPLISSLIRYVYYSF